MINSKIPFDTNHFTMSSPSNFRSISIFRPFVSTNPRQNVVFCSVSTMWNLQWEMS